MLCLVVGKEEAENVLVAVRTTSEKHLRSPSRGVSLVWGWCRQCAIDRGLFQQVACVQSIEPWRIGHRWLLVRP